MIYYYNTPKRSGPYKIPLPIQNAYLRDYANRQGLAFSLPVTEYIFDGSWMGLVSILEKSSLGDKVVTFSICAIIDIYANTDLCVEIRELILKSNIEFVFILENLAVHAIDLKSVVGTFTSHNAHRLA